MLSAPQIIYNAVLRAAKHGLPCPTNTDLAAMIGANSPATSVRYLQALHKKGLIVLHSGNCRRVVEIPALRLRTAGPMPIAHWRERKGSGLHNTKEAAPKVGRIELMPNEPPAPPGPVMADGRACFRCGVRSQAHEAHGCQRWVEA